MRPGPPTLRIIGWAVTLAVAATVVVALFVAGSPREARMRKADAERASDLSWLTSEVRDYYKVHKELPKSLTDISDLGDTAMLRDPLTGRDYEYRVISPDQFELCAVFETDTVAEGIGRRSYGNDFERHPAGRSCVAQSANRP